MIKSNSFREKVVKRKKEVLAKINSCRENFEKREKEVKEDLEEAARIWKDTSETLEKRKQKVKNKKGVR